MMAHQMISTGPSVYSLLGWGIHNARGFPFSMYPDRTETVRTIGMGSSDIMADISGLKPPV